MDNKFDEIWRKTVTRSWSDKKFRQELIDNPNKVLASAGATIPSGINFVVVENEPSRLHLILPQQTAASASASDAGAQTISEYNAACF